MEMGNDEVFGYLERIARGEEAALQALYRIFSRRVYAFALGRLKDPAQAEEVVVDTLHEVWRFPTRFRGESKFSTWLLGIARYKVLNLLRARDPEPAELDENLPGEDTEAFELIAHSQRREGVQHCLGKLSREHRECLHLVFYEGLSLAEVAAIQAVPENTVKTRLFHARQKMKGCLQLLLEREAGYV